MSLRCSEVLLSADTGQGAELHADFHDVAGARLGAEEVTTFHARATDGRVVGGCGDLMPETTARQQPNANKTLMGAEEAAFILAFETLMSINALRHKLGFC